jgi:hypothetical protein
MHVSPREDHTICDDHTIRAAANLCVEEQHYHGLRSWSGPMSILCHCQT